MLRFVVLTAAMTGIRQSLRTIQEFLGHADSKTMQIYAHYARYAPSAREVEMVNQAFAIEESGPAPTAAG